MRYHIAEMRGRGETGIMDMETNAGPMTAEEPEHVDIPA
jgi:hypothetical protein